MSLDRLSGDRMRQAGPVVRAGVALFPSDGADAESLLRNAEAALKDAKRTGNQYLFYAPQMNARVAEQLKLENDLRRAVLEEQFVLYYQPRVDVAASPRPRRHVVLEAAVAAAGGSQLRARLGGQGRPAQVRVQDDAGGIDDGPQRRVQGRRQCTDGAEIR